MLTKRIIPCLDIRDGRTVKGINFLNIADAGDPVELAARYAAEGADELVFLDITATVERRKTLVRLAERVAREVNIPFTVGGGITSVDDVHGIILSGADKISLNSSAVRNPDLITSIASVYGSQCVTVAIDTGLTANGWEVFLDGGRTPTGMSATKWAKEAENRGAGEILLTSMRGDGTKNGFSIEITKTITEAAGIPVVASGGAGKPEHFSDLFEKTGCSAALAASVFHYGEIRISDLKNYLKSKNIPVRL
jgi:cyclase